MKLFIDTADTEAIKALNKLGVVDGVTTNPSLVAKTGRTYEDVIKEVCELVDGPVSAETVMETAEEMISDGKRLAAIHPNVVVKIPLNGEGLQAVKALSSEGIKTNVTLCFSAPQGWLAAKAGATYISPFIGRLDDIGHDGMELISQLVTMYDNYGYDTEVLAASIRHPIHVIDAAMVGADVATVPPEVVWKLLKHPLTDMGIDKFLEDAKKIGK